MKSQNIARSLGVHYNHFVSLARPLGMCYTLARPLGLHYNNYVSVRPYASGQ